MTITCEIQREAIPSDYIMFSNNEIKKQNIFENKDFLEKYDRILMLSKHYKTILQIHFNELYKCNNPIDLACGTGNLIMEFAKQNKIITGLDISKKSLEFLAKKVKNIHNITLLQGDISKLAKLKDETYDGASSMIAAHLIQDFDSHIKEAFRILKPNGIFILTAREKYGNQEQIVEIVKKSLIQEGVFNNLFDDYNSVCNNLLRTAKDRSPSLKTKEEIKSILLKTGFRNIEFIENNSNGVMYTVKAIKH